MSTVVGSMRSSLDMGFGFGEIVSLSLSVVIFGVFVLVGGCCLACSLYVEHCGRVVDDRRVFESCSVLSRVVGWHVVTSCWGIVGMLSQVVGVLSKSNR